MASSGSQPGAGRSIWPPIWLAFALIAAALVARAIFNQGTVPLFADTDDAMRLTVVRDLIAGQGWYDPVQHRLNTPYGAELHWSRLIDVPVAGLILMLRPLAGPMVDTIAVYLWPLLLLFCLLVMTALITVKLVGREGLLPALALPAFSLATLVEFAPGRIDHHSVQILLTLVMLYCAMEALSRPRFAIGAGIAAATALAIGIESLPSVAAAILAFGLMWVLVPGRADALRRFGASFGLATLVHAGLALPPERWLAPACDAISLVYVALAIGVGVAFVLLSLLPARQAPTRLLLGVMAGAALVTALVLAFPACLGGPYAGLDPWLVAHWISRIREAVPLWESIAANPVYSIAAALPPLFALAVTAYRARFGPRDGRGAWLIYGLFLALAVVVMLVQIRGSRLAAELATPAGAWLIVAARRRYLAERRPLAGVGLIASWIGFAGIAVGVLVNVIFLAVPGYAETQAERGLDQRRKCLMTSAFAELAALPPARVMSYVDLGAHVLAYTPHAVVAAPYHRNQRGVRDAFEFFNRPLDQARAILDERGITLVVICPQMPEMEGLSNAAADSFVKLYARHALPGWLLDRSSESSPLKVYEVTPR
ncbi:MAG: hypothetical protein ACYC0C_02760 [Devosia sp.]